MPADRFRPLNDAELDALSDEQLFEYFLEAREVGDPSAVTALQVLAYGYWNRLGRRALVKIPPGDVEDVVGCAVEGAVKSALSAPLQGRAIGQFRDWLYEILRRQIANYHRRKSLDTVPLFSEHDDNELVWEAEPIGEDDPPGEIDNTRRGRARDRRGERTACNGSRAVLLRGSAHRNGRRARQPSVRRDAANADDRRQRVQDPRAVSRRPAQRAPRQSLRAMSDVDRLLSEFIAEDRAGGEADPRSYLDRLRGRDRLELEALIVAYLERAPRQRFDPERFAGSRAEAVVRSLEASLLGASGEWPSLLPRLRSRAELRRRDVVKRMAHTLGVSGHEEKVVSAATTTRWRRGACPRPGSATGCSTRSPRSSA